MTMRLADVTTLRVGGPAQDVVVATDEATLIDTVRDADRRGIPTLILGGGSNVVIGDDGFAGRVVLVRTGGMTGHADGAEHVRVSLAAGEPWDAVVARTVDRGWSGIEALSGIPGLTGATVMQNVGAYGQDLSQVLVQARVFDRLNDEVRDLSAPECELRYRASRFKDEADRWLILGLDLSLVGSLDATRDALGQVAYPQVAHALGVAAGAPAPIGRIRDCVLDLRRAKGMVVDPDDPESTSVGSFFTNPILEPAAARLLDDACPRYPDARGIKVSAAWLIEAAGFVRGFSLDGRARISRKHVLALVNGGTASAQDVLALAAHIHGRVRDVHGITLELEPTLVGCAL